MFLISASRKRVAGRNPRGAKFAFYALAIFAASIATVATGPITPALAVGPSVTAPSPTAFARNTSGQEPGNFVIANFDASATLLVSIGFVDPPTGTSFALPTTTGLTAGFGYDFSGDKTQISFTGTQANANTALAAMTVTTGSNTGNVTVRVSASVSTTNVYFNPINGNYYEFVSTTATTDCKTGADATCITNIEDAIASKTLYGAKGYWATITSAQENSFVGNNMDAPNIAIGLSDRETEDTWMWLYGPERGAATYFAWADGEPNNYDAGEDYVVTNWGSKGEWNDFGRPQFGDSLAYIVEYSADCYSLSSGNCVSGSFSGSSRASATVTNTVDVLAPAFTTAATSTTSSGPYTFTVDFSVSVTGVESSDFTSSGTRTGCSFAVTGSGTTYTLTVSACSAGNGTVIPVFAQNGVTNAGTPGPLTAATSSVTVTYDSSAPTISSFTSTKTNGTYSTGTTINITATASESIRSGNTLTVTLETGTTDRTVLLTASSAGTTLVGTYIVQAGDASSDLTVKSFVIGTVADTAGNAMTSTSLPTGANIADTSAIVIDASTPASIGFPNLDAASDSGLSNTDDNTSDTTPTLTVDVTALEAGATGTIKATKAGSADVSCNLTAGTCTLGTLANGTWSIVSFQTDAAGNVGSDSSALSVTIDSIAPTSAILAASSATATSATITFTVTGSEQLDCTSLSTAAGTDFLLTAGISSLTSIAQTSNMVCTISATSTAVAGGSTVNSTLTVATSFSVSDPAGNARTTLTGSPQSISVTVPANSSGSTTNTTTVTTTTTIAPSPTATVPSRVAAPAPYPSQPRVTVPGAPLPKKVVVLTPVAKDDPTAIVADLVRQLAADGNTQAANKVRSAVIAAAPAIGRAIADATERLANVLQDKSSTNLDIIRAKAAVADAASLITLTALRTTNGNVQSLALPITRNNVLPEVEPGNSVIINSEGAQSAQLRVVKGTTLVLTSGQENLSLAMSAIQSDGRPAPISTRGTVKIAQGQNLAITGSGFKPNSKVAVWIFSSPRSFGSVITDANGSFAAEIPMPDNVAPGNHTAQVNGQRKNGDIRSLNLGLEVILEEARATIGNPTQSIARKMSARVRFDVQSFVLTKSTQKQLIRLAQQLQKVSTISVRCVGYTQEGIIGGRYELAQNRADAVCQRLRKLGVTARFDAVGLGRAKVTTAAARHVQLTITFASPSMK
jgi:outer membrane protein OmpA-like peptidoglycan-associated protein